MFSLSLTFDIEMCTNFPYWTSVWDHRKGQIDDGTKQHITRIAGVGRNHGVKLQFFVVGSALEDDDLDYLRGLVADGHALGNHTYRHVNVKARTFDELQPTYRDAPQLRAGLASPLEAIAREVSATTAALDRKLGVRPAGFRTPGGFGDGLRDEPDVQDMLFAQGFAYASSHYHCPIEAAGRAFEWDNLVRAVAWSVQRLQPYRYPNGLLEIPMMALSDIHAFRTLDLDRGEYLRLLLAALDAARRENLALSLLMHPQVQACRDPHCEVLDALLDRAEGARVLTNDDLSENWF
jgi:peptidoglycan/xylan/chitin deacetylase (PgdA/CDA1 family)